MNKSFFSNIIWKLSERIIAQGISFIISLILARLLLPEQFGLVALVMIFINIADGLVISGFNTSLIQKKDADDLDFSTTFWFCFIISLIIYVTFCVIVVPISRFYNDELIVPIFRVLGVRLIISSINTVQHAYVSRHLQFKKYFCATLYGTICSALVGIGLALKGYGVWALVFQYLVNSIIDTIVLFFTIDFRPKLLFSIERLKGLFSFGWKILIDSILGKLQDNLRGFIIGKIYTSSELAYYSKARNLPDLIMKNVEGSIISVLLPTMSNVKDNKKKIKEYIKKSSKLCSYVLFPLLLGIALVSKEFVLLVLTDKWAGLIPYLCIYCFYYMISVLCMPRTEAYKAVGRSDVFLSVFTIYRIFDIILLIIFLKNGPFVIMLTQLISGIFRLIIIMYATYRINDYNILEQLFDCRAAFILCLCMGIIVWSISLLKMSLIVSLFLKIFVGFFVYITISKLLNIEEYNLLVVLLRNYIDNIAKKIGMKK